MAKYTKYAELKQESEKKTKWVRVLSVSVILSLIAVIGLAINNSAQVDASSSDENSIVKLQEDNKKLTSNLEKLQASFVEIDTKKKELETQKAGYLETIATLNADKETNLEEIERLNNLVTSLESDIAELEIELEEVKQNLVQGNVRLVVPSDPLTVVSYDLPYLHLLDDVTAFDENGNQTNDVRVAYVETNIYENSTIYAYYMTGSGENSYIAERTLNVARPFDLYYGGKLLEENTLPIGTPINFSDIEVVNNSVTFDVESDSFTVIKADTWEHVISSHESDTFTLEEGGRYCIQYGYGLHNKYSDEGHGGATVYEFNALDENNVVSAKVEVTSETWNYVQPTIISSNLNDGKDLVIRVNVFDYDQNYIFISRDSILKLQNGYESSVIHEGLSYEFGKDVMLNGSSISGQIMEMNFFYNEQTFNVVFNIDMLMTLEVE